MNKQLMIAAMGLVAGLQEVYRQEERRIDVLMREEPVTTQGPDSSPYAKRARKGKGQRKAHRAGRWG